LAVTSIRNPRKERRYAQRNKVVDEILGPIWRVHQILKIKGLIHRILVDFYPVKSETAQAERPRH
jgi:hypothetical protein